MAFGPPESKPGHGANDMVAGAGPVVQMRVGTRTCLRQPRDAKTVSAKQIVQVIQRAIDVRAVGFKLIGDQQQ